MSLSRRVLRGLLGAAVAAAVPVAVLPSPAAADVSVNVNVFGARPPAYAPGGFAYASPFGYSTGYGYASGYASAAYDDWQYERQRLRAELDDAQFRLDRSLGDADAARAGVSDARRREADAGDQLAGARTAAADAARRSAEADGRVAAMRQDRDRAAQDVAAVHQAADPVLKQQADLAARLDAARRDAVAAFEASDPFRNAAAAVGTARRDVSLAEQQALDVLTTKGDAYAAAEAESKAADAKVAALRDARPPGDPELAAASSA
ncbi:MAG: hypothetical protein JWO31_534, partial [Phycisphaerales bacterium]|nr:hypothetical protein [Phycisphaerales bacterium]